MESVTATKTTLRPLNIDDIEAATLLSQEQSWPHREDDWKLFLSLGEGIGAQNDGVLVGTIMCWTYGEYATIGMVIVKNSHQGQGIGRILMQAIMKKLEGKKIILNATTDGIPLYSKLGFEQCGKINQHQALAPNVPLIDLKPEERVRPICDADISELAELYSNASGMDKKDIFPKLSKVAKCVALTRDHSVVGFAQLRRFGRGWLIGPVVAPDLHGAKALILHWLGVNTGKFCRLDVVESLGLSEWLNTLGIKQVGSVTTMIAGKLPNATNSKNFAISSQALG